MQIIGDGKVRLIPDVLVGNNGSSTGLVDALLSLILWNQTNKSEENKQISEKAIASSVGIPNLPKPPSSNINSNS
jgi:uncharacterized membrane protein YqiK